MDSSSPSWSHPDSTSRPLIRIPLVLPRSWTTTWPSPSVRQQWIRETRIESRRASHRGSRPTTTGVRPTGMSGPSPSAIKPVGAAFALLRQVRLICALHPKPECLQGSIALGVGNEPVTLPHGFAVLVRHADPVTVKTLMNRMLSSQLNLLACGHARDCPVRVSLSPQVLARRMAVDPFRVSGPPANAPDPRGDDRARMSDDCGSPRRRTGAAHPGEVVPGGGRGNASRTTVSGVNPQSRIVTRRSLPGGGLPGDRPGAERIARPLHSALDQGQRQRCRAHHTGPEQEVAHRHHLRGEGPPTCRLRFAPAPGGLVPTRGPAENDRRTLHRFF